MGRRYKDTGLTTAADRYAAFLMSAWLKKAIG